MNSIDNKALFDGTHDGYHEVLDTPYLYINRDLVQFRFARDDKGATDLCIATGLDSFFEVQWEDVSPLTYTSLCTPDLLQLERTGVYSVLSSDDDDLYFFHDAQRRRSCLLTADNHFFTVHALFPKQARSMLGDLYNLPSDASEGEVRQAVHLAYNAMLSTTTDSLWLRTELSPEEDRFGEDEAVHRVIGGECSVLDAVNDMHFNLRSSSPFGSRYHDVARMRWSLVDMIPVPQLD